MCTTLDIPELGVFHSGRLIALGDVKAFEDDADPHARETDARAAGRPSSAKRDRFEAAHGKAQVKWRTDDLMALLRGVTDFRAWRWWRP